MKIPIRLLGLGDNVVDIYEHKKIQYPGGNALNVAAFALMLNAEKAAYLGFWGNDAAAEYIRCCAMEANVDISRCQTLEGESGWSRVTLVNGDRIWLGSNQGGIRGKTRFQPTMEQQRYISEFDVVHIGCYGFMEHLLEGLHQSGTSISFDFSDDMDWDYVLRYAPLTDYAFLSMGNTQESLVRKKMAQVQAMGPQLVIATRGNLGSIACLNGQYYQQDAKKCVCLVDTMGAGDAFIAAFLVRWIAGKKHGELESRRIQESLSQAVGFSAKICEREGAFGNPESISEGVAE